MNCPVCPSSLLVMTERQGIEIDYCPECRGVWLDRGELDKIIERSESQRVSTERDERSQDRYDDDDDDDDRRGVFTQKGKKRKRGGFLSDIFEFGD